MRKLLLAAVAALSLAPTLAPTLAQAAPALSLDQERAEVRTVTRCAIIDTWTSNLLAGTAMQMVGNPEVKIDAQTVTMARGLMHTANVLSKQAMDYNARLAADVTARALNQIAPQSMLGLLVNASVVMQHELDAALAAAQEQKAVGVLMQHLSALSGQCRAMVDALIPPAGK